MRDGAEEAQGKAEGEDKEKEQDEKRRMRQQSLCGRVVMTSEKQQENPAESHHAETRYFHLLMRAEHGSLTHQYTYTKHLGVPGQMTSFFSLSKTLIMLMKNNQTELMAVQPLLKLHTNSFSLHGLVGTCQHVSKWHAMMAEDHCKFFDFSNLHLS